MISDFPGGAYYMQASVVILIGNEEGIYALL